jgi:hypothetical protein
MKYVTRICYNTSDWFKPTGDARDARDAPGTFYHENHFGLEEWLFRTDWQIDACRYSFIQGVNKSRRRMLQADETFDLTLFTIQSHKRRRYVATIRAVECLNEKRAKTGSVPHFRMFRPLWLGDRAGASKRGGRPVAGRGRNYSGRRPNGGAGKRWIAPRHHRDGSIRPQPSAGQTRG